MGVHESTVINSNDDFIMLFIGIAMVLSGILGVLIVHTCVRPYLLRIKKEQYSSRRKPHNLENLEAIVTTQPDRITQNTYQTSIQNVPVDTLSTSPLNSPDVHLACTDTATEQKELSPMMKAVWRARETNMVVIR
jgi:hypothetical protein